MEQEEKTVLSLAQLQQIQFLAEILRYGSITLVFQDGVLIQIDAQWRQAAKDRNISFVQAAIEYEKNFSNWTGACLKKRGSYAKSTK